MHLRSLFTVILSGVRIVRLICRVKLILRWLVISMLLSLLILSILRPVVLGTKFNVRAREEEDRVVTTLLQGSVRMESPRTVNNGYLLKPGQTLNINTTTYQAELIEYAEPTEVLLWINGKLKFKQHSLLEITNIMEKLYDLKFVYDDESLKVERFTGEFSTDNLPDEILNVLMHTNHFSYKKEGRIIRLSKK